MVKTKIEFINTCPCCDGNENFLREVAENHADKVDITIYNAGKDFNYLEKYGQILRGTLIINESEKHEDLNRKKMAKVVSKAIGFAL
ncbi:MAG: thioredoxin-like protein [Defluviitaleaceae bacterium]|nr:thioredoxin-like protein [Defluviitaleaceae bacterium]